MKAFKKGEVRQESPGVTLTLLADRFDSGGNLPVLRSMPTEVYYTTVSADLWDHLKERRIPEWLVEDSWVHIWKIGSTNDSVEFSNGVWTSDTGPVLDVARVKIIPATLQWVDDAGGWK